MLRKSPPQGGKNNTNEGPFGSRNKSKENDASKDKEEDIGSLQTGEITKDKVLEEIPNQIGCSNTQRYFAKGRDSALLSARM